MYNEIKSAMQEEALARGLNPMTVWNEGTWTLDDTRLPVEDDDE